MLYSGILMRSDFKRHMPGHPLIRLACAVLFIAGCAPTTPPASTAGKKTVEPAAQVNVTGGTLVSREQWERQQSQIKAPSVNLDPCATNLQELSGALLLYVQTRQQMPASLEDLRQFLVVSQTQLTNVPMPQFTCPVTHQSYGYYPDGLSIPEDDGRIVIFDSRTAHGVRGDIRWAVRIVPSTQGRPPYATVIPLTDEMFSELQKP
jgi:hypothetical protein